MDNNVLFGLINKLSGNYQNQNNSSNFNNKNFSDYPDVVFTKNTNPSSFNQTQTQPTMQNGALGLDLKQLLPLLINSKKYGKSNTNILEQISPQFSQIMSLLSNGSKKTSSKKNETKN